LRRTTSIPSRSRRVAQAEGDLPRATALLAPLHPNADNAGFGIQVYQAILKRLPAQIIPRLKEILAKPDPAWGYGIGELHFDLVWAQEVAGDHAAAQESWRRARSELEPFLKEQPEQAMATNPIEEDALLGAASIAILARVAAQMGESDAPSPL
jgi:hypothetical protein